MAANISGFTVMDLAHSIHKFDIYASNINQSNKMGESPSKYWQNTSFLGPLDLLPWRVVGRSVRPSVNTCNSATNFRIFFKIGGNIPWVNISRPFFRFCKIFNFEFKKNKFQFKQI